MVKIVNISLIGMLVCACFSFTALAQVEHTKIVEAQEPATLSKNGQDIKAKKRVKLDNNAPRKKMKGPPNPVERGSCEFIMCVEGPKKK